MLSSEIPFYTQTSILDRYIHRRRSEITPGIIESIVELLQENEEIKAYFFRNRPHPDWAIILWEKGFLNSPPLPIETPEGNFLPRWDFQDFLIGIADTVPDIVIKHVNSINGSEWYISQALRALTNVPVYRIEEVLPRLLEFLSVSMPDSSVYDYIYDIMLLLAKNNFSESAFQLFEAITEPVFPEKSTEIKKYFSQESKSKSDVVFADWKDKNIVFLFSEIDSLRLIRVLETHLRKAVFGEATELDKPDYKQSSSWRSAIDDSDQNHHLDYKEVLLDKLREAVDIPLKRNDPDVSNIVRKYLVDEFNVFKRIGIHFVREYPTIFRKELKNLLKDYQNLDDYFIHHEYFLLLRDCFRYLTKKEQQNLIITILNGPPNDTINNYSDWWESIPTKETLSKQDYVQRSIKHWIHKRLWMIRENLIGQNKAVFSDLNAELGEPGIPPEFTSYMSTFQRIQDISPFSTNEIALITPPALLSFLVAWKPEIKDSSWPNEQTYASLGREVAKVIFENPKRYQNIVFDIAQINSGYGYAIVDEFARLENPTNELWQLILVLAKGLLEIPEVRLSDASGIDDSWYYFRSSLARLLGDSFSKQSKKAPNELLPLIRDILVILVNDIDPNPDRDQPSKESAGFGDPLTVALNSIRPVALNALISCVMDEYKNEHENYTHELGPKRLSKEIKGVLDAKLDSRREPSRAVRSVIGQRLINLCWLDKKWVEKNLDRIFPTDSSEESKWLFVSAISSYTVLGNYFEEIFDLLKPKYEQAVEYFSKGYLWKSHLQPVTHLAGHLLWDYLLSDCDFNLAKPNESILFIKFFKTIDAEGRKDGAFICRRVMDAPTNVEKHWLKVRKIWEWRVQEAVQAGHVNNFDEEICNFAQLVAVAPSFETIQSLWSILIATVPHLRNKRIRDLSWHVIEEFLAKRVDVEPLLAIKLYALMYEQVIPQRWQVKKDEERKIIETAVKDESSKQFACDLINFIGSRLGDDIYRDLYEKYC
jgi:hypothetical protein